MTNKEIAASEARADEHFKNLRKEDLRVALRDCLLTQGEVLEILAEFNPCPPVIKQQAQQRHAWLNDDIQIDSDPLTSEADNGTWVSAWVWVPRPEREEDEDEGDADV